MKRPRHNPNAVPPSPSVVGSTISTKGQAHYRVGLRQAASQKPVDRFIEGTYFSEAPLKVQVP